MPRSSNTNANATRLAARAYESRSRTALGCPIEAHAPANPADQRGMLVSPRGSARRTLQRRTSWRSKSSSRISGRRARDGQTAEHPATQEKRLRFPCSALLFPVLGDLIPCSAQRIPCSCAQGIPAQVPESAGQLRFKSARKPPIRGYSLFFSLLAGNETGAGDEFAADYHRRQLVRLCRFPGQEPSRRPNISCQSAGFARARASIGHQRPPLVSQRRWLMARLSLRSSETVPFGP
jgi:hypothetical protein